MKKLIYAAAYLVALTIPLTATFARAIDEVPSQISWADTTKYAEYAGKYKMQGTPFDYVVLSAKDGKLYYVAGDYQGTLTAKNATDEFDANGQATVKFNRDPDDMVKGMTLNAQGENFMGTREAPENKIEAYVGKYKMTGLPFEYIELTDREGKLHYEAGEYQGMLEAKGGKDQFDANGQADFNFTRDASDQIKTIKVDYQGQSYVGNREADANSMAAYAGQYKMEGLPFETMEIKTEGGKLLIDAMGQVGELTPLAAPDQFDAAGRAILKFNRDASGQVTGVTLDAQGQSFGGKKQ